MVIDSVTSTSTDETITNEDRSERRLLDRTNKVYSEWRLFQEGILSCYSFVTVNEGFQNRDFQTSQGAPGGGSVIDPEILGNLRNDASAIHNQYHRSLVLFFPSLPVFMWLILAVLILLDLPQGVFFAMAIICSLSLFLCFVFHLNSQRKIVDDKMTALVECYQPIFLQTFGVELGLDSFNLGDDHPTVGFFFRCPRRTAADVHDDCCDEKDDLQDECYLPAVYIHRLIPGEIHVEDKEYDAASMKWVDADTWALLQSTHERRMLRSHLMMTFILLTLVYLLCFLVGVHVMSFSGNVTVWMVILGLCFEFVFLFCFFFPWYLEYYYYPRFYKKVTTMVNEVLQQQQQDEEETTPFLSLEFHDSEVPGREGILGRRYQFVVQRRQQDEEEDGARKEMV